MSAIFVYNGVVDVNVGGGSIRFVGLGGQAHKYKFALGLDTVDDANDQSLNSESASTIDWMPVDDQSPNDLRVEKLQGGLFTGIIGARKINPQSNVFHIRFRVEQDGNAREIFGSLGANDAETVQEIVVEGEFDSDRLAALHIHLEFNLV